MSLAMCAESLDELNVDQLDALTSLIKQTVRKYSGIRISELTKSLMVEAQKCPTPVYFSIHGLQNLVEKMIKDKDLHEVDVTIEGQTRVYLFPKEAVIRTI